MTRRRFPVSFVLAVLAIGAVPLPLAAQQPISTRPASTAAGAGNGAATLTAPAALDSALPTARHSFAPMLTRVIPAVVTIKVLGENFEPVEFPRRGAGGKAQVQPTPTKQRFGSGGSGVVIDAAQGLILTNHHVVENATAIRVDLADGRRMLAELVGQDAGTDVAVLRVKERRLPQIKVGDSDTMQVGDVVVAVGNPFGLEGTATMGIISAVMRTTVGHGTFEDYLQIDAPINPGNSGGALVNINGELIGINTVTGGGAGTNVGIGFAIPVNMAITIMNELVTAGRMRRGSPGIIVEDLPARLATQPDGSVIRGALVKTVLPRSAAAEAGIKPGDIIVAAGNKPVRSAVEYITRTVTVPLGTKIPFILFTQGQGRVVALEARDLVLEPDPVPAPASAGDLVGATVGDILLGNPLYGDLRGAQVMKVAPRSKAFAAGLLPNDVITGIDAGKVRSVDELFSRLQQAGMQYRIMVMRDGVPGWIRGGR